MSRHVRQYIFAPIVVAIAACPSPRAAQPVPTPEPTREIHGRVLGLERSAPGASQIEVLAGQTVVAETTSEEDGLFTVTAPISGTRLRVNAPDYAEAVAPVAESGATEVQLKTGVALGGFVIDGATREPIAGARVACIPRFDLRELQETTTDAFGRYLLPHCPEFPSLTIRAEGYGFQTYHYRFLRDGQSRTRIIIELDPPLHVSGRVVDEAGQPVPDVDVFAWRGLERPLNVGPSAWTRSDAEGRFELPPLYASQWRFAALRETGPVAIQVHTIDSDTTIDIRAASPLRLAGTVTLDDAPIEGAEVKLGWWYPDAEQRGVIGYRHRLLEARGQTPAWIRATVRTDAQGHFDYVGLVPGRVTVNVAHDRGRGSAIAQAGQVDLVVALTPGGRLVGEVVNAQGEIVDVHGKASLASLSTMTHAADVVRAPVVTEIPIEGGRFEAGGLTPGKTLVSVMFDDHAGAPAVQQVELSRGETSRVQFTFKPLGSIKGRVVDAQTQQPVSLVTVFATPPRGGQHVVLRSTRTDGRGEFILPGLQGTVELHFRCGLRGGVWYHQELDLADVATEAGTAVSVGEIELVPAGHAVKCTKERQEMNLPPAAPE